MIEDIKRAYGARFEPELIEAINRSATLVEAPEGQTLIKPGQYIRSMPLLLSGNIKILRPDNHGYELLLYHLEAGDSCAMTMTCCLAQTKSEIHAISETTVRLLMVPVEKMEEWVGKYRSWRNFAFDSYHGRMMELLESIDNIAFHKMDERIAHYLDNKSKLLGDKNISITHQEIANDLHTSRVVVSRLLKTMENQGLITLHRNSIQLV